MKRNKILLAVVFLMIFGFILSSCSKPTEETDPNAVKNPEKIESADSDPIKEQPQLTDIAVDENLRAAYDAICNYLPYRLTNFTDAKHTVYRTSKITFDDLDPEYVLSLAYGILPECERETTIEFLGKYSPYGYNDGNLVLGPYDPDHNIYKPGAIEVDVEYTSYSTDEFDEAIKTLFGDDAGVEYQAFSSADGNCLVYNGTEFKGWKTTNSDEYFGFSDFSILLYAETDGEFVYVTDKFASFDYGFNKDGYFIVKAIYGDGAQTDVICSGNDVPNNYRVTQPNIGWAYHNYSAFIFNGQFPGLYILGDYMQTYKHTFKLAEDGTYYWVSSEPVEKTEQIKEPEKTEETDSDNKEILPLTEISFEGDLEAAYDAICNYQPYRMSNFKDAENTVYRTSKITFEDLDPEYFLSLAYDILPEREREIIIEDAGVYSDSAYISGEYEKENIKYTVYTADEIEKAVKTLFGEDVSFEHKHFYSARPYNLVYDGKKYLSYNSNRDGDFGYSDYSVVIKAETDGEFVYVTDKFASIDYDYIDDTIVSVIYSDGGQTNLLHSGEDIPYDYRTPNLYERSPANDMHWGGSLDLEVFGDLMQTYKHTFKLAEDGTYYWISSEPIED